MRIVVGGMSRFIAILEVEVMVKGDLLDIDAE